MDTIILLQLIQSDKLDSHEKIILASLAIENKGNGTPIVWSHLQKITGLGPKKVKDYVAKLIQNELIVVSTQRARKKIVEVNFDFMSKPDFTMMDLIQEAKKKETNPDLAIIWTHARSVGFPSQGTTELNRRFAYLLYKREGREKTIELITKAVEAQNQPFAPVINDFYKLYKKVGDLRVFFMRKEEHKNDIINI